MDIQIQGFTAKQRALADIMWTMDSKDKVNSFISTLMPKDRREAEVVLEMIILAFMDQVESVDEAKIVLDKFRK
jgi:hypothetical protein